MPGFSVSVRWPLVSAGLIAAFVITLASMPAEGSPGITTRVSVTSAGAEVANTSSITTSISGDGRFVAFEFGGHLVPDDVGQEPDIHVHDRQTGVTERIGLGPGGEEGNWSNWNPIISQNGRFVIFYSYASNLVPDDTNNSPDVFLYDRSVGATELVSLSDSGKQASDQGSSPAGITDDGRFVLFTSNATNLVAGDSNDVGDVFLRDRVGASTERLSVSDDGEEGNATSFAGGMTPDGRFVLFSSEASNLLAGDMNGVTDAFILDTQTSAMERIRVPRPGGSGDLPTYGASISDDGRFVALTAEDPGAFGPYAFLRDRELQTTTRIGLGAGGIDPSGGSRGLRVSGDGSVMVFSSDATNLVRDLLAPCEFPFCTSHLYAYDRRTGNVEALSVTPDGRPGNRGAGRASVSANGLTVAFDSDSSDLVPDDTNTTGDAFVRQFTFTATSPSLPPPTGLPSTGGYNSEGQAETIRWLPVGAGLVLAAAFAAWGTRRILRRFNY